MIFVALAVAWALYLIPKALSHHDEMARTRSIESFSDSVRVLGKKKSAPVPVAAPVAPAGAPAADSGPVAEPAARPVARTTRAAAKRAAARRRRVLGALLLVAAVLTGLSAFAVTPWWSVAVPGAAIVVFLVVARLTVRRAQAARRAVAPVTAEADESREDAEVPVAQRAAEVAMPLEDEGSLWDPLPMTLPTYVNKARARRTVRTIELTQVASSGHDAADSALVAQAEAEAEVAPEEQPPAEQRKAAGA